jgi:predicted secreted protein
MVGSNDVEPGAAAKLPAVCRGCQRLITSTYSASLYVRIGFYSLSSASAHQLKQLSHMERSILSQLLQRVSGQ